MKKQHVDNFTELDENKEPEIQPGFNISHDRINPDIGSEPIESDPLTDEEKDISETNK